MLVLVGRVFYRTGIIFFCVQTGMIVRENKVGCINGIFVDYCNNLGHKSSLAGISHISCGGIKSLLIAVVRNLNV